MMHLQIMKTAALSLLLLIIAACSTTPTQVDVDAQHHALVHLENWQAEGKLGVRVNGEAHSAFFDWQNQPEQFALRLSGPLGQGTTWLRRSGTLVTLESADQPKQQAATAEELMQHQLGWQVPVSNLSYWIKGIAAPDAPVSHVARNPDNTLAELHQQGWRISFSRYGVEDGWALPGKLQAKRNDIAITVIIKDWRLPRPATLTTASGSL